jgi:hypothetical protein
VSDPDMHNQSSAEGVVREIRKKWYRIMFRKNVPKMFWDYGVRWVCEIMSNQSPAEGVVREIRKKWYRIMFRKNIPKMFWDYGVRWVCEIMSCTHTRTHRIDGGTPLQKVREETVVISNFRVL